MLLINKHADEIAVQLCLNEMLVGGVPLQSRVSHRHIASLLYFAKLHRVGHNTHIQKVVGVRISQGKPAMPCRIASAREIATERHIRKAEVHRCDAPSGASVIHLIAIRLRAAIGSNAKVMVRINPAIRRAIFGRVVSETCARHIAELVARKRGAQPRLASRLERTEQRRCRVGRAVLVVEVRQPNVQPRRIDILASQISHVPQRQAQRCGRNIVVSARELSIALPVHH